MQLFNRKKVVKKILWTCIAGFVAMNLIAIIHAYKFTHFSEEIFVKTKNPEALSFSEKLNAIVFGVDNPRPKLIKYPSYPYETILLKSNKEIECWYIPTDSANGTVIVFHGFSGNKSQMLDKSEIFHRLGYNTLLVDFMGSGGSEGNQTSLGYFEAEQVKTCFNYIRSKSKQPVFLFGTSMGASAIMKAASEDLPADGLILECPFGTLYNTVSARFNKMNIPAFPMAGLLVFWGGAENGFWAFGHNPIEYAAKIKQPVLFMFGGKDDTISMDDTKEMFSRLQGTKQLKIYPEAAHENYLVKYAKEWEVDVACFLKSAAKP